MSEGLNVAVAGATGAVGQEMVRILEERKFPVASLTPLASERSVGKTVEFKGKEIPVEILSKDSFKGLDLAVFFGRGRTQPGVRSRGRGCGLRGSGQLVGLAHGP